jgi:hypothetical protein
MMRLTLLARWWSRKGRQRTSPLRLEALPETFRWIHGYSRLGEPAMQLRGTWRVSTRAVRPTSVVGAYVKHGERKTEARVFAIVGDATRPARERMLDPEQPTTEITTYALLAPRLDDGGTLPATVVFIDSWGYEYRESVEFAFTEPELDQGRTNL